MFTINGVEHSVSSEHNLTEEKCYLSGVLLKDSFGKNPPFQIDEFNQKMVLVSSKPYYVCVPTSLVGNIN